MREHAIHFFSLLAALLMLLLIPNGSARAQGTTPNLTTLPPEVRSGISENTSFCKTVQYNTGFLTNRDVNGDGVADYIVDYGKLSCDGASNMFCGTAGCSMQVIVSLPGGRYVKVWDDNVNRYGLGLLAIGPQCFSVCMAQLAARQGRSSAGRHSSGTGEPSNNHIGVSRRTSCGGTVFSSPGIKFAGETRYDEKDKDPSKPLTLRSKEGQNKTNDEAPTNRLP